MLPKIERLENRQLMSAGPALTLASSDALPFTNRLIFNRIQNQNPLLGDLMHDSAIVRLINTGDQPLTIQQLSLSSSDWQFAGDGGAPMTIGAGQEVHVQLNFVATTLPAVPYNETAGKVTSGGGTYTGTLTINSNDAAHPTQSLQLAGYWQKDSEHGEEPSLQTIVNLIGGYKTNIASGVRQTLSQGSTTPTYYGEEIAAPYWMAANPNQPVNIQQIASWHVQGRSTTLSFYDKGDSADPTTLLTTLNDAGQELFPEATPDYRTSFTPAGAFGLTVDGEFSDDTLNTSGGGGGHHFRFYPLRDANNNLIPNSFLVAQDYGGEIANFDFQDGVFILTNARPEAKLAVPANLTATVQPSLGISLQWSANVEPNLAGYNVYRGTSTAVATDGPPLNGSVPQAGTSYVDRAASNGI
ncbi:MAG TPA: hypothetical protein VLI90_17410, partial [Tepidisphaeraceae bacterium]|nr:hypothetical protein [Tepidisphaeraceae bacterium]